MVKKEVLAAEPTLQLYRGRYSTLIVGFYYPNFNFRLSHQQVSSSLKYKVGLNLGLAQSNCRLR